MSRRVICAWSGQDISPSFQSAARDLLSRPAKKSTYRMILSEGVGPYLSRVARRQRDRDGEWWWIDPVLIGRVGSMWSVTTQAQLEAETQEKFFEATDGETVTVSERRAAWLLSRVANWPNLPTGRP